VRGRDRLATYCRQSNASLRSSPMITMTNDDDDDDDDDDTAKFVL